MGDAPFVNRVLLGGCLAVLQELPDECIDAVVTDPPYGLGDKEPTVKQLVAFLKGADLDTGGDFMGANWEIPSVPIWREVYRVLKPGGHVLSFGGTRTWDLISLGLRAAGFESRDTIADEFPGLQWCQGMGMPKSLNVSKAIDKAAGAEREVVGIKMGKGGENLNRLSRPDGDDSEFAKGCGAYGTGAKQVDVEIPVTVPATPEAQEWEGWGTGLKPAWEPIVVFRKPFEGTVAKNVLRHGTGAINIGATRVKHANKDDFEKHKAQVEEVRSKGGVRGNSWKNASDLSGASEVTEAGRWPANMVLVHAPGCKRVGEKKVKNVGGSSSGVSALGQGSGWNKHNNRVTEIQRSRDTDGLETVEAWQCAEGCPVKALDEQSGDRPVSGTAQAGALHYQTGGTGFSQGGKGSTTFLPNDSGGASRFFSQFDGAPFRYTTKASKKETSLDGLIENDHPTKKPVDLMRWLVRLVCPKGGIVLDPYCGSGSTLQAASEEDMRYVGIERDPHSHETATLRMDIVEGREEERRNMMAAFDIAMGLDDD